MFCHGGLDAHGYLVYEADRGGLLNQNWKDSAGAVCFRDGTQAAGAIAVSEVQGYAYDALRRTAGLARDVWHDLAWARRLEGAAEALRDRFRADFWMPDADFPALALDGDGRRVDVLASDAGHLLWSGLLDPEDAAAVGRRLLESDFFSGWGIRTLASGQPPYHPLSYHRGSIWPHDNALIVLGLAANGLHEAAATVTAGLLDAAAASDHRLPEVISGYPREGTQGAVPYPHANSPQAWAAATPSPSSPPQYRRRLSGGRGGAFAALRPCPVRRWVRCSYDTSFGPRGQRSSWRRPKHVRRWRAACVVAVVAASTTPAMAKKPCTMPG